MKRLTAVLAGLVLAASAGAATAQDIQFTVSNETGSTITALYMWEEGSDSYEDDMLNGRVRPGEELDVLIQDDLPDCVYDIRIEFSDGNHQDMTDVDICSLNGSVFAITD